MKDIPYEKVSLKEAKTITEQNQERPHLRETNWKAYRSAVSETSPNITDLLPWLQELPEEVRPKQLIIQYAHIANRLSKSWKQPVACKNYFNELMLDGRGNRQGFPPEVAQEITALFLYFNALVPPQSFDTK